MAEDPKLPIGEGGEQMEERPLALAFKHELETFKEWGHLTSEIDIRIPVRPTDGLPVELAEQVARWCALGFTVSFLKDHMGGFIEVVRANMAQSFVKKSKLKYLFMIDNDVIPRVDLPLLLARHNKHIVGAPVPITLQDQGPALNFTIPDGKDGWRFPAFRNHEKMPSTGLIPVHHIGTGAMCIRRDVLEAFSWEDEDVPFMVSSDLRAEGLRNGNLRRGEDIEFCNQARNKGFKIYADMEGLAGHRKLMTLTVPDDMLDPTMDPAGWISNDTEYLVGG